MIKNLTLLLITLMISCSSQEVVTVKTDSREEIIRDFIALVENDVTDDNINGSLSIAILEGNKTIASKTFGYTNSNEKTLADSNTIYRIGSMTKSFTGFLLLQLQDKGILNLDDPIEKYLPEIKGLIDYDKHPPITFKQLASHTSGLDRESRNRASSFGPIREWEEKVINAIPETSFRNKPGDRFRYSNIGYAILGLAISRAGNMPYTDMITNEILQPLGMHNTYFEVPEDKKINIARGMGGGPTAEIDFDLPLQEHEGRGYRVPNGGIYSTSNDIAKFMKACMGHSELLSKESISKLQSSQTPTERMRSNYSYGFQLYNAQGIYTIGHGGSTPGYSSHFEFEKDSGYGIVIMRNYNFGNTNLDLRSNSLIRKLTLEPK